MPAFPRCSLQSAELSRFRVVLAEWKSLVANWACRKEQQGLAEAGRNKGRQHRRKRYEVELGLEYLVAKHGSVAGKNGYIDRLTGREIDKH